MNTKDIANGLGRLFSELIDGAPRSGGYMLNPGDPGLLQSLDRITADAASKQTRTGSSIASHTDHLRYGFSLMNRWSQGENPFGDASWNEAWKKPAVSDAEWQRLRDALREEARRWSATLEAPREVNEEGAMAMVGSIAHLAYHLGAIRQIDAASRGPSET